MASVALLVCRSPADSPACREAEAGVAGLASSLGIPSLLAPHLCYLRPAHPAVVRVKQLGRSVIVAGWLAPRALEWTARFLFGDEASVAAVISLGFDALEQTRLTLSRFARDTQAPSPCPETCEAGASPRWYPVVDYDACQRCGQCADFCLFGVYVLGEDRSVRVAQPDNCKTGCPACARVCPKGAILFPDYKADRRIAGWEQAPGAPAPAEASAPPPPSEDDGLDALIDELDQLER